MTAFPRARDYCEAADRDWWEEALAELDAADELIERLEAALRDVQAVQPNRVQWFLDNGIVFRRAPLSAPPEADDERWEQIAFSVYTDLCQVEFIARAALNDRITATKETT